MREAQWDPAEDRAITFVMPHLAGGSVHDALLEGYRFSIYQSIAIAIDALDALAYVHREFRALHRDTKPGNVLLDENRHHGYLSDLGSAAVIDDAGGAAAVLGTNVYRPPESRLTGRVTVDADIYGIGMMLFEILNGRLPWEELDLAAVEVRLQRGLRAVPDSALQFPDAAAEPLWNVRLTELKVLERTGLLLRAPRERAERRVYLLRQPSAYWDLCQELRDETRGCGEARGSLPGPRRGGGAPH